MTDAIHHDLGLRAGAFLTVSENLFDFVGMVEQVEVLFAGGTEMFFEDVLEFLLGVAPAHTACTVACCESFGLFRRCKEFVQLKHVASIRILRFFDALGVRHNLAKTLLESLRFEEDVDVVVVGLAHLAAIETWDNTGGFLENRFRNGEHVFAKVLVELDGDIASKFNVLLLVLAHRHDVSAEHENVGIHEARVAVKAHVHVGVHINTSSGVGFDLSLVSVGAVHEALRREAAESPAKFKDFRNIALLVEQGFFRVETESEPGRRDLVNVRAHFGAVLHGRQSVIVRDEIDRVVSLRKFKSRADCAHIVAEMGSASRLDTGK